MSPKIVQDRSWGGPSLHREGATLSLCLSKKLVMKKGKGSMKSRPSHKNLRLFTYIHSFTVSQSVLEVLSAILKLSQESLTSYPSEIQGRIGRSPQESASKLTRRGRKPLPVCCLKRRSSAGLLGKSRDFKFDGADSIVAPY